MTLNFPKTTLNRPPPKDQGTPCGFLAINVRPPKIRRSTGITSTASWYWAFFPVVVINTLDVVCMFGKTAFRKSESVALAWKVCFQM